MNRSFKKLSDKDIKNYLLRIKKSIHEDVGTAIDAYWDKFAKDNECYGSLSVPRMLFPEIDGLGSYLTGDPKVTSLNIKLYLQEIMSQIDKRYKDYAAFIVLIFRHGLLHQHSPKRFKFRNRKLGWEIHFSQMRIRENHLVIKDEMLNLEMTVFFDDILESIDLFIPLVLSNYRETFLKSVEK